MAAADTESTIVPPGPELLPHLLRAAAAMAKYPKEEADRRMERVLASAQRERFLFFDRAHVFYAFFLSKLTEFRDNPALAKPYEKQPTAAPAQSAPLSSDAQPAVSVAVRSGGSDVAAAQAMLAQRAAAEARAAGAAAQDPAPRIYGLDLQGGTVEVAPAVLDVMVAVAQYVAKFGAPMLEAVQRKYAGPGGSAAFRFLTTEDPRHATFLALVRSYEAILATQPEVAEARLEALRGPEGARAVLQQCEEKVRFIRAEIARRKLALLTTDELRRRLEWERFAVVHTFTLSDLGLDRPAAAAPATSAAAPAAAAAAAPAAAQPSKKPAIVIDDNYTVRGVAPAVQSVGYFVDAATGQRVAAADVGRAGAAAVSDGGEPAEKKPRTDGAASALADADEFERNLRAQL